MTGQTLRARHLRCASVARKMPSLAVKCTERWTVHVMIENEYLIEVAAPADEDDQAAGDAAEAPTGTWCETSTVRVTRGATKQRWKRVYRGPRFFAEGEGPQGPGWMPTGSGGRGAGRD